MTSSCFTRIQLHTHPTYVFLVVACVNLIPVILALSLEIEKTEEIHHREETLLTQLVTLVNQRNQLVQIEDTQLQQRFVLSFCRHVHVRMFSRT